MSSDEIGQTRRPRAIKRPHVASSGPLRKLKDLVYELYLAAGAPALDEITRLITADDRLPGSPSRDSVHRILSEAVVPPSQADTIAVVTVLARAAVWDVSDAARRARELWVEARMDSPPGTLVDQLSDPIAYEVKRPIDADHQHGDVTSTLPAYIPRAHDAVLACLVEAAVNGRSGMAVLIGGSSTGKTRACWEAVTGSEALRHGWRLWHPIDPSHPEAALAELPRIAPRTVLWLNDLQHYLAASGLGGQVAAGIRALLRDPSRSPVLVLGTIWPEYWDILTARSNPNEADTHAQARALLDDAADIAVPSAFAGPAMDAAKAVAERDSRIRTAVRNAEDGRIAQYLAGVPELISRYCHAPPAARALIHAAMDAIRMGHSTALSHALLAAAAPGYLSDWDWDGLSEDWVETALAYCTRPCHGARGPLTRIRPRADNSCSEPSYRLADYLEQAGRAERRFTPAPATLWDALATHAPDGDLERLAEAAEARGRYRHAFRLFAAANAPSAWWAAGRLLHQAGQFEEALDYYRRIAATGDIDALSSVAELLCELGRTREALECYRQALEGGDSLVLHAMIDLLCELESPKEALLWLKAHADTDDLIPLCAVARILQDRGDADGALRYYKRAAERGEPAALTSAAEFLGKIGRQDEALAWISPHLDAGDARALYIAGELMREAGRVEEARRYYQRATETDNLLILGAASLSQASLMNEVPRNEDILMLRTRVDNQDPNSGPVVNIEFVLRHDIDMQLEKSRRAVEEGNLDELRTIASLLRLAGRADEAIDCYQHAAEAGVSAVMMPLAELLDQVGRADEAQRLRHYGFEPNGQIAGPWSSAEPQVFTRATSMPTASVTTRSSECGT